MYAWLVYGPGDPKDEKDMLPLGIRIVGVIKGSSLGDVAEILRGSDAKLDNPSYNHYMVRGKAIPSVWPKIIVPISCYKEKYLVAGAHHGRSDKGYVWRHKGLQDVLSWRQFEEAKRNGKVELFVVFIGPAVVRSERDLRRRAKLLSV